MILVYAISLGISAGVTGLFVRQALGEQGYVPGFTPGLMLACGAAAIFAAIQLLYVALVRLAWPTKTNGPLLGESVSHGAVGLSAIDKENGHGVFQQDSGQTGFRRRRRQG